MKYLFWLSVIYVPLNVYSQELDSASYSLVDKQAPVIYRVFTIDGKMYDSIPARDKIYVLNFWFIGCGPCRQELPLLNELASANAGSGDTHFIAISTMDPANALIFMRDRYKLNYEQVADGKQIADLYNLQTFPANIVIDKDGKVVFMKIGFDREIKDHIQKVLDSIR